MKQHKVKDRRSGTVCFEGNYRQCQTFIKMQRQGWGPYPPSGDAVSLLYGHQQTGGTEMQTINLEIANQKGCKIANFLDDLMHVPSNAPGLSSYHAAQAVKRAMLLVGTDRRCAAVKKAVKQFSVIVSIGTNERGFPAVRMYSPAKQIEIFL